MSETEEYIPQQEETQTQTQDLEHIEPVEDEDTTLVTGENEQDLTLNWEQQRKAYQEEIDKLKSEMISNRIIPDTIPQEPHVAPQKVKPKKKTVTKKTTRSKKVKIEEPVIRRRILDEDGRSRRLLIDDEDPLLHMKRTRLLHQRVLPRRLFLEDMYPRRQELYEDEDLYPYAIRQPDPTPYAMRAPKMRSPLRPLYR
jgi:hypothetical protein